MSAPTHSGSDHRTAGGASSMSNAAARILEARDEPVRRGVSGVPRPLSRMTLCRAGLEGAALRSRSDRGHIRARTRPPIEPAVGHAIAIHIAMAPMVKEGVSKWHCDDQGPRASGFMSQPGGRRARDAGATQVSSQSACPGLSSYVWVYYSSRGYLAARPRPHYGRRDI